MVQTEHTHKETKESIHKTFMIMMMITIGIICLFIGVILGVILQQVIIYKAIEIVAPAFDGVSINIDLNETQIVDEMTKIAINLQQQTYRDPHNINLDATCPGRNTTKTVAECIREVENKSGSINNCVGIMCNSAVPEIYKSSSAINCTGGYCSW